MAENDRPDLREQTDVEPRTRRDMREADRADDAGRETTAGRTSGSVAQKIRKYRKKIARRRAEKQSRELKKKRRRRERTRPVREVKEEVSRLREEAVSRGGGGLLGRAVGAVRKLGADSDVGARGTPGAREDDPAVRAGETAMAGAPIDATLDPFGGPNRPEGPMQLAVMAGGGPVEIREQRRREAGVAHLQEFAAGGGLTYDDVAPGPGGSEPLLVEDDPIDVDPNPLFDDGRDR